VVKLFAPGSLHCAQRRAMFARLALTRRTIQATHSVGKNDDRISAIAGQSPQSQG
jgi:hypothetical protein